MVKDINGNLPKFDGVVEVIVVMTAPDQQPTLNYWGVHLEIAASMPNRITNCTQGADV